jgi:hypothetical protein
VYAAGGRPAEALQSLLKGIELEGGDVQPEDWLVVGKVAEHYGLLDDAVAAYRRVTTTTALALNSVTLAKRWTDAIAARQDTSNGR